MATTIGSAMAPSSAGSSLNKRKRGPGDQDVGRNAKAQNTNGDHDANYAALLQGIDASMSGPDDSTRTAQAALAAPLGQSAYPEPTSFEGPPGLPPGFEDNTASGPGSIGPSAQALYDARQGQGQATNKPAVGTNEWHQLRKDNHKEGNAVPRLPPAHSAITDPRQLNAVVERSSMRASRTLPRSSPGPRRTRGPFCSAHANTFRSFSRRSPRLKMNERRLTSP